jgi:probable DNA repair protein
MYDWLTDALDNSATVITANRRLARVLEKEYAAAQLAAGRAAWRTPAIYAWQDWLAELAAGATNQQQLPTRINVQQSQLLWERCLRKTVDDPTSGLSALVRMARDTWQRLADWRVAIGEVARSAVNDDQRMFASAAGRYLGLLEHENWIDDAGIGELVLQQIVAGHIGLEGRFTFAGFERERPIVTAIQAAMAERDAAPGFAPPLSKNTSCSLQAYESPAAELRAAGAWARQQLEEDATRRVAIVTTGLEKDTDRATRLVREGMTPGWQHGHTSLADALNVSYGQRLAEFPAISSALLLLRWLVQDLPSIDVGLLLRSSQFGSSACAGRSCLELRLRQLPDRRWSPSMVTAEFRGHVKDGDMDDTSDWMARLAAFSKRRRELPQQASPADWVVVIDEILSGFLWPGQNALDSRDFQLINRWRELLNEFARLGLVSAQMSPALAVAQLEQMAGEIVFQPESKNALVQLLGPLEASGTEFDRLWLAGVTTANWPPVGTPSQLVSRRLQEKHDMPDCSPANTQAYAEQVLTALIASSETVVCSYPLSDEDAEQTPSDLISALQKSDRPDVVDPGWYASTLLASLAIREVMDDVPSVRAGEKISGGAGTIQRQVDEPISAFVQGRLSARPLYPQAIGIPAPMRGNLIHDALYHLYIERPKSEVISSWQAEELDERVAAAVAAAFIRHERNTDAVLHQLLQLERRRIEALLRQFVALDGSRGEFSIASVEGKFDFVSGRVELPLRFDRIDSFDDGSIAIIDYKTGSKKRLLNHAGEVQEIQLFVYACATDVPVSALTLVNIDSREISFDGAGRGYRNEDSWPELLQRIKEQIAAACDDLSRGDVRINIEQGVQAARPLNLLTRYTELKRDDG